MQNDWLLLHSWCGNEFFLVITDNIYAALPHSSFKKASVWLMNIHQVWQPPPTRLHTAEKPCTKHMMTVEKTKP